MNQSRVRTGQGEEEEGEEEEAGLLVLEFLWAPLSLLHVVKSFCLDRAATQSCWRSGGRAAGRRQAGRAAASIQPRTHECLYSYPCGDIALTHLNLDYSRTDI